MRMLTEAEVVEVLARSRVVVAHHEAAHAVAAVLRGGEVLHVVVGDPTDAGLVDVERELMGRARHRSAPWDVPLVAFAGPWAEWRIRTETGDAEDLDLYEWLDCDEFNNGGDPLGDYALMGYDTDEFWTRIDIWTEELERYWSAIVAVADLALAGDPVNSEVIKSILGW
jgi:hypothetical protein